MKFSQFKKVYNRINEAKEETALESAGKEKLKALMSEWGSLNTQIDKERKKIEVKTQKLLEELNKKYEKELSEAEEIAEKIHELMETLSISKEKMEKVIATLRAGYTRTDIKYKEVINSLFPSLTKKQQVLLAELQEQYTNLTMIKPSFSLKVDESIATWIKTVATKIKNLLSPIFKSLKSKVESYNEQVNKLEAAVSETK